MVTRRRFLLEAALVLLVDDDQAESVRWSEDGTAGADDDLHLPRGDAPPVAAALGVAEMTVQHGDIAAAAAEPLHRLRSQADLRHQDQRLLPLLDGLLDGAEVDFRLAAAGDAVQQESVETGLPQRLLDGRPGA